jgi:GAF domain-containing protein
MSADHARLSELEGTVAELERRLQAMSVAHDEAIARRDLELSEALKQQAATAEVLKVISRSGFGLETVLQILVDSAVRLCASDGVIYLRHGDEFRAGPAFGHDAGGLVPRINRSPRRPGRDSVTGRVALSGQIEQIPDNHADPDFKVASEQRMRMRALLGVPLLRGGQVEGVFVLGKPEPGPFGGRAVELVRTFADQAVIALENARLMEAEQKRSRELAEALERQSATSEILRVISQSPTDVAPVLKAIVDTACEVCDAYDAAVILREGDHLRNSAHRGPIALPMTTMPISRGWVGGRAVVDRKPVHVRDLSQEGEEFPEGQDMARRMGHRTILAVPLLRESESIGAIVLRRTEAHPFGEKQIEVLQTFADQAVIAIGNVRLFEEVQARTRNLTEALQMQTATSDVLKVISRSAFDLDAVLDTLIESARKLCEAPQGMLLMRDGPVLRMTKQKGYPDAFERWVLDNPQPPSPYSGVGRAALTGEVAHFPDVEADPDYRLSRGQQLGGYRALLSVPLLRENEVLGVFSLGRPTPGPFTDRQIELVKTFADQAVIAIENVRLFEEVQARTRDVTEALEQQTATADVLKAISRTAFDLDTVLESLISTAVRLCEAKYGEIFRRQGDVYRFAASLRNAVPGYVAHEAAAEIRPGRGTLVGRVVLERGAVQIADAWNDPEYAEKDEARMGDVRAMLGVPLMRDGEPIGAFALARSEPIPFTRRQVELVKTFADQAVIAIENVRLFDEVQARTRDLAESLQQQTATAEVLKVISRSAFDLQTVLDTLVSSANDLSGAIGGTICVREGDQYILRSAVSSSQEFNRYIIGKALRADRSLSGGRALLSGRIELVPDTLEDPEFVAPPGFTARSALAVPLLREGRVEGVFSLARTEPHSFTKRHIELVQTFADQAVIAIENVRLFDEVQARTRDLSEALQMQTATADVLKVISRSAFDLQTVFNTLVSSAVELGGAMTGTICVRDGDVYRYRDTVGAEFTSALAQYLRDHPAVPGRATIAGRVLLSGKVERIPDCLVDPEYVVPMGSLATNVRSLLGVPLLRNDGVEGAIILTRAEPGDFTQRQIEIVQTFADQAVIALENVRLFDEVQARTKELAASLDNLRRAQDRLVQSEKLASLGQLTAGIAHEIKNPLNFVNNFSALSRELLEEMRETLAKAQLGAPEREEIDELLGMLDSNLEKVVSHGKRADSIVKNMLLHSREGSGVRASANVNAIVEEALNLAYHGARAEKPGFNVTIVKTLDPQAGEAEIYAQEINRVLLNLISNGFYATTKRKQNDPAHDPTITASTRDLGDFVEIAIRDNGVGISDEVRAKMFNPFFTTKPAGEGTGLGLSLSHDIVAKQHGGSIDVATELGAFTQFSIRLPRKGTS